MVGVADIQVAIRPDRAAQRKAEAATAIRNEIALKSAGGSIVALYALVASDKVADQ